MPLHPDFPVVTGHYRMTADWAVDLPEQFNRRLEDGSLVLWRPALTFWIIAWNNHRQSSEEARLQSILATASELRGEEKIERAGGLIRLTYELSEEDDARAQPVYTSISGYVIAATGHLQISAYFDDPRSRAVAYRVMGSVRHAG
jgi:hypothetical protein